MVFIDEQRLHLGAEAEVWRGSWMGQSAIRKHDEIDHGGILISMIDSDEEE